jgi:C1A family cysteine protease
MRVAAGKMRITALAVAAAALLALAVLPAAATAAQPPLIAAPIAPGFAQAAADPTADRLPNPVQMKLGGAAQSRASLRLSPLPSSYLLGDYGRLSPVKDQDPYNTCWAFANVAALESALLPGGSWDLSEDNLVTRAGFSVPGGRYGGGGYDAMAVAYFVRWAGPVTEADDPYPSPVAPAVNHVQTHVQDVVMLPGRSSVTDNALLKQMVYDNGALSVGMYWSRRDGAYKSSTTSYYDKIREGENHGVCIVGWDNAYAPSNFAVTPPGKGAFIVRNSWGSAWGDGGYFYVSYFDRSFAFSDCTSYRVVDPMGARSRVYQYDKLGLVDALRPSSGKADTALFANRFTARASESVTAVGFYSTSGGGAYKVLAGPTLRNLTVYATGTIELPGFHTVALDTPLPVVRGARFVVAVRLTTPGGWPVPVETRRRGYSGHAYASPGQSYVRSTNTQRWTDLTKVRGYSEANVCLKAYTN